MIADDHFKFDENGRKFSKRVGNTVGKGKITCYKQFLHFPQCFQKICTADMKKPGLIWERHNSLLYSKIVSLSKLKTVNFAGNILNLEDILEIVVGRIDYVLGKF